MSEYKPFFWISGIEAIAAGLYLFTLPGDPKNSVLFGFSLSRLLNIGVLFTFGLLLIAVGFWFHRNRKLEVWLLQFSESAVNWQKSIWAAVLLILAIGLIPVHKIRDFELIWERLLPSVWLAVGILVNAIVLMVREGINKNYFDRTEFKLSNRVMRIWLVLLAVSGVLVVLIWLTNFGITPPIDRFWNTAGVPVLYEQVLYLIFGYILVSGLMSFTSVGKSWRSRTAFTFLVIWGITFLIWNGQPITKSYFVYQPAAPNYQYYPLSDAQRFDIGGQFMLVGQGIFNGISEEKPFEMAYLALLQALTESNYLAMVRIQVLLLSLITPFLYFNRQEVVF